MGERGQVAREGRKKAKVVQNMHIMELLLSIGRRKIAEAKRSDKFFAIWYHLNDERALDTKRGKKRENIVCQMLKEIREEPSH